MATPQPISLLAPIGGINRAAGFQSQPPFSYRSGKNVRSFDVFQGMADIGSRPGLAKQFSVVTGTGAVGATTGQLGGGNPIRLAAVLRTFNDRGFASVTDSFTDATMANWTAQTMTVNGDTPTGTIPVVSGGSAKLATGATAEARVVSLTAGASDISTTGFREVTIVPVAMAFNDLETYHLYLDLDNTGYTENAAVAVRFLGTTSGLQITWSVDGVDVQTSTYPAVAGDVQFLKASIDSSNTIRASWRTGGPAPEANPTGYLPPTTASANARVGFALSREAGGGILEIESFSFVYISSSGGIPPEATVFSANGHLYHESVTGSLAKVTTGTDTSVPTVGTNISLASDIRLYAANRLEKLYIADYKVRHERVVSHANINITFVDGTHSLFDDTDVTDWTALGIDITTDVLEITAVTGAEVIGIYAITAISAANGLTYTNGTGATGSAGAYRVLRYPKVYDAALDTFALMSLGTVGTSQPPAGCKHVVLWQGRLVWSNDRYGKLYMSEIDNPLGYNYAGTSITSALSSDNEEFFGLIGEPYVGALPVSDDVLLIGCRTSFYYILGNPRAGGITRNISWSIGLLGPGAWCRTDDGRVFAMTPKGLYEITLEKAIPVSENVIPIELIGLTDDLYETSCEFNMRRREIIISASGKLTTTASVHYCYELKTGAFHPDERESDHDTFASVVYQPGGVQTPLAVFGGRDGYIRRFDDAAVNDDGFPFDSEVWIGPVRGGRNALEYGFIREMLGVVDTQSGDVMVHVHGGDDVQAALSSDSMFSFVLTASGNYIERPDCSAAVFFFRVAGTPCSRWALRELTGMREFGGRLLKV